MLRMFSMSDLFIVLVNKDIMTITNTKNIIPIISRTKLEKANSDMSKKVRKALEIDDSKILADDDQSTVNS